MSLANATQFNEMLKGSRHALVTFRKDWNVDAAASALALARVIGKRGGRADIVADGFAPTKSLSFLPGHQDIQPAFKQLQKFTVSLDVSKTKVDELTYHLDGDKLNIHITPKAGQFADKDVVVAASDFKYDLIITLNTPDYASLGPIFAANTELFYRRPTINIDHETANERYGNFNAVDITAASTAEVVHGLLDAGGESFLDGDVATCLLAGVIHKTRSFRSPTVSPRTLDIASELIAAGARRDEIVQNLYRTRPLQTLKLWGRALARLKYDPATKMVWTLLVRQDFIHAGTTDESLEDVLQEMIASAPEAEVAAVLYEQEDPADRGRVAGICALVSSEQHEDAGKLMVGLRPEGDRRMARVCFPGKSLLEAETAVLETLARSLSKRTVSPAIAAAAS